MLHTLPKTTYKKKKRAGRGYGSGKGGHTTGRGTKGQKARYTIALDFEGTARGAGTIKKYPYLRGKGKFKSYSHKSLTVPLYRLNIFDSDSTVTLEQLIKKGFVEETYAKRNGVKIIHKGMLTKKLIISLPVSKGAREAIEKAGGKVTK